MVASRTPRYMDSSSLGVFHTTPLRVENKVLQWRGFPVETKGCISSPTRMIYRSQCCSVSQRCSRCQRFKNLICPPAGLPCFKTSMLKPSTTCQKCGLMRNHSTSPIVKLRATITSLLRIFSPIQTFTSEPPIRHFANSFSMQAKATSCRSFGSRIFQATKCERSLNCVPMTSVVSSPSTLSRPRFQACVHDCTRRCSSAWPVAMSWKLISPMSKNSSNPWSAYKLTGDAADPSVKRGFCSNSKPPISSILNSLNFKNSPSK